MSVKIKSKIKVKKSQSESDSDDGSNQELFYYADNRVQLMKEVLKLLKPKKIKAIAPDFMKNLDIQEINSMLLEELLGISKKRLKNILNGVNVDESSSDSEEEKEQIDIISLDDISDVEDFNSDCNGKLNEPGSSKKSNKKIDNKKGKIKTEKMDEKEKLMSVLEILELQARARAIRSQLALENQQKTKVNKENKVIQADDSDIEEIIVQDSLKEEVVVIDSENEDKENKDGDVENLGKGDVNVEKGSENEIIENKNEKNKDENLEEINDKESNINLVPIVNKKGDENKKDMEDVDKGGKKVNEECHVAEDTVVINLDSVEIDELD
ncbi:DNA ligase 1-like [Onthophagus taurus]|uniref:DNA ligase 1-like n=1 Tax=Onthophagus taurus TaxID=166361 RepID=UPI0039BDFD34